MYDVVKGSFTLDDQLYKNLLVLIGDSPGVNCQRGFEGKIRGVALKSFLQGIL